MQKFSHFALFSFGLIIISSHFKININSIGLSTKKISISIYIAYHQHQPKMQSAVSQNPKKTQSKQTRNDGKKKVQEKKTVQLQINCLCKRKCAEQIDALKQQEIFEEFNSKNNWPTQTRFLRSLISIEPEKEKLDPVIGAKQKENSYAYHFIDEKGPLTRVCLTFFTKVLQVSRSKVFRAVDTIKKNPDAIEKRGKAKIPKTNTADLKYLKDFVHKFVSYESSCRPQKLNAKYLHPRLSLRQMFSLYSEDCAFKKRKIISDATFRKVVHDSRLMLFRKSQKKCEQCSDAGTDSDNEGNTELKEHIDIVRKVKQDLISSVEAAQKSNENTEIFTFKLHRAIDLPHISDNDIFFKRQLWCNIFTVYDQKTNETYFYVWDETVASRGPNEIASCLYKHFLNHLPKDAKK